MEELNYKDAMDVVYNPFKNEMECAKIAKELMKKSLNPFRKIACWRSYKMFIQHCIGIEMAMRSLNQKITKN